MGIVKSFLPENYLIKYYAFQLIIRSLVSFKFVYLRKIKKLKIIKTAKKTWNCLPYGIPIPFIATHVFV